jgi:hypothetical protein
LNESHFRVGKSIALNACDAADMVPHVGNSGVVMRLKHMWTGAIALAALTVVVSPAFADHHGGGGGRSGGGSVARGVAVRGGGPRVSAPRMTSVAPRFSGAARGVAVARVGPGIVGSGRYGYGFSRPYYAFRPHLSLGFGLWAGFPVAYPYYSGYPYGYPYPYPYPDPYSYSYPYSYPAPSYGYPGQAPSGYPSSGYPGQAPPSYPSSGYPGQAPSGYPSSGYPPAGTVGVQPGAETSGGVSFEITPNTAGAYVDGNYVGTVATFGPMSQPLPLAPGRHHIEVRAPGYQTMAFDTDAVAGQVIPYQGTMQRQ